MKRRILSVILTLALSVSTLAAVPATVSAAEGETIIFAQAADPRSLDPALADDGESTKINTNIYEGLVQYAPDSTEIQPCLAESWDVSEDGLAYTFHLREGVKFHDGTDFNAEAVKTNYDRQLPGTASENMSYAGFIFGCVKDIVVDDEYTVTINLTEAQTPFLANLAMIQGSPIVSPKALEENNNDVTQAPCGTGPYKFVRWDVEQDVILTRNEDYWGEPGKADNIIFKIIKDNSARVIALNNGEADIIDGVDSNVVDQITAAGNIVQTDEAMMTNYMAFNTTDGPMTSKEARIAVAQAINVPELVETLYKGYDEPATTFLPTTLPGYDESITGPAYDPEAAKAALEAEGITSLHILTYDTARPYNTAGGKTLAEAVQGYLLNVGVECTIDAYDWTTFKTKAQGGDYDLVFAGWGGDNGDPDNFLNLLATTDVSMNYSHFQNDEYNALIAEGLTTPVGDERSAIYTKCEEIIAEEMPMLPISHANFICGVGANVEGFYYHVAYATKLAGVTKK